MTAMDEPCLRRSNMLGKTDGFVEGLMGMVWQRTQSIDNQHVTMFSIWYLIGGNSLHISDIYYCLLPLFYTIAKDRKIVVHNLKRSDAEITNSKGGMRMNLMKLYGRNTRIAMLGKAVWQHLKHSLTGNGVGIDIYLAKLTIGTDIVHSTHVVVVGMRDENAINASEGMRHNLLSEVRTAIDEDACLFCLDKSRAAQPFVMRIGTTAGMTLAANSGDATRCSSTKKGQFHITLTSG